MQKPTAAPVQPPTLQVEYNTEVAPLHVTDLEEADMTIRSVEAD